MNAQVIVLTVHTHTHTYSIRVEVQTDETAVEGVGQMAFLCR